MLRPLRTGNLRACSVTSQLVQLLSFLLASSLSASAQASFSPPHPPPSFPGFWGERGETYGRRVPRGVDTRVLGRLKGEGTKHWVCRAARIKTAEKGRRMRSRECAARVWELRRGGAVRTEMGERADARALAARAPPLWRFLLLLHRPSGSAAIHPGADQRPHPAAGPSLYWLRPPALRPLRWWCRWVAALVVAVSEPKAGSAESFPEAAARL